MIFSKHHTDKIREDMCGFEEITHKPEIPEFRPTPTMNPNATTLPGSGGDGESSFGPASQALLGGNNIMDSVCLSPSK